MAKSENIQKAFELAKAQYAELGVDVEDAMNKLEKFPISLHCLSQENSCCNTKRMASYLSAWPYWSL